MYHSPRFLAWQLIDGSFTFFFLLGRTGGRTHSSRVKTEFIIRSFKLLVIYEGSCQASIWIVALEHIGKMCKVRIVYRLWGSCHVY